MSKRLLNTFFILILILSFPSISFSEEIYEYERMWPVIGQPWYFYTPGCVAVDSKDYIYVADTSNNRIQKFTSDGQFIANWGNRGNGDGQFDFPTGIAVDTSGYVYVADPRNHRIQKFTSDGLFVTKWGSYGNGNAQFDEPWNISEDRVGNLYVVDTNNHRIQKFTSDGLFVTKWGSYGSENGQFKYPRGIKTDSSGYVYVSDYWNNRIQKFTSNGQFITKWGSLGWGDGQFYEPMGIAIDSSGYVYVADKLNERIQKFTSNGQFITKWGSGGSGDGQFWEPWGISVDSKGYVYVADKKNDRIQKFASNGQFIAKWGSSGSGDGQFHAPEGIAIDNSGYVYASDYYNDRIQKFTSGGQFVTKWGSYGSGDGQFNNPCGIAVDSSGYVYVVDQWNSRIQKFTSNGQFITKWDGQFYSPRDIALGNSGYVYVADSRNHRIQKFTSNGQFIAKWGSYGSGDGQFDNPLGICEDKSGNIYVADSQNNRIQKFTVDGQFITKWGSYGSGDGQFDLPRGIKIDSSSYVYVSDSNNNRIQKFTVDGQFITKWGSSGSNPGEFSNPIGISISSDGKVFISDTGNNRIQVFSKVTKPFNNKAIVVAGSGPYKGNNLWEDIQKNANRAYLTLTPQGYTNDTIYYLSSDININLDLNGDGKCDVDADATKSNLQYAITQWAKDAESLVVYLIGHGGDGTFRMSEAKTLEAEELASWLNELQQTMQGLVIVIYEACHSGSFLSKLIPPSGKQRIIISSAASTEEAQFLKGGVSFSYFFWGEVLVGANIYDAYVMAKDSIGTKVGTERVQNPQIDDDGNGIYEGKKDGDVARGECLGKCFKTAGDIPTIKSISPDQKLNGQTSATIMVEVVSAERITNVWAVVYSPDFSTTPDNPITNLPSFDLTCIEQNRRYEGTYNGLTVAGTYTLAVYAMNEETIISLPKTTEIEQTLSDQYTLTVTIVPSNSAGSVSKSPDRPTYFDDEQVTLTATPNSGYTFSHWTGDASGSTNPITLTMDGNKTVTANFTQANAPDIFVTPLNYDFGNVKVKKSKSASFRVQNNGEANLTIAALVIGPDASMFKLTGGGGNKTIKPGKFSTLKVTFKPTSKGPKQATLRITSNDPDTSLTDIPLSGTGQ